MTKQYSKIVAILLGSPYFMIGSKGWDQSRLKERRSLEDSKDSVDKSLLKKIEEWNKGNMDTAPTTNAEELVTNAISSHNKDPWYMDLLSAALDREDVATVNEAILIANRAYEEQPIPPTINLDEDESDGEEDMGDEGDTESGDDEEVMNAVQEASEVQFVSNESDEEEDDSDDEVD